MTTQRILFTVLTIVLLLGVVVDLLLAQMIGPNNSCTGISLGTPPAQLLNCSLDPSLVCFAGSCVPWISSCNEFDSSQCSNAGPTDVCSGTLYKDLTITVGFPDGTSIGTNSPSLGGHGATVTSQGCLDYLGGMVISVFPRLECWPSFSTTTVDQSSTVREVDSGYVGTPDICGIAQIPYYTYLCVNGFSNSAVASHTCCAATCNSSGGGKTCSFDGQLSLDGQFLGDADPACQPTSPILVDVTGDGYELTDLTHGVSFNLTGRGPQRISWTNPQHGNAWLALDRNANGVIDDGTELFGNFTPQPKIPGVAPNGFLALAVYDLRKNGGNGIIDPGDAVWGKLWLWMDSSQNGISEPGELHGLDEFGIAGIELDYHVVHVKDKYGNQFYYRGRIIEREKNNTHQRTIWDVLLLHQP